MQNGLLEPQKSPSQYVQYASEQRNESDRHAHRMHTAHFPMAKVKNRATTIVNAQAHTLREKERIPNKKKEIATIIFYPHTKCDPQFNSYFY